jgi:kexin
MALVLSVRPDLTWRDAQYLLVEAATPFNLNHDSWTVNAVGRLYSHTFGYGKIDAYRIVEHAKTFKVVGPALQLEQPVTRVNALIPQDYHGINSTVAITQDYVQQQGFHRLEHITVKINILHERRGDVQVRLISPRGIVSVLSPGRRKDDSDKGFTNWEFMTVAHWGEDAVGVWTLNVKDAILPDFGGEFVDWTLKLWGEGTVKAPAITRPPIAEPKAHAELSKITKKPVPVEELTHTVTVTQTVLVQLAEPTMYAQKAIASPSDSASMTAVYTLAGLLVVASIGFLVMLVYIKRQRQQNDYHFKPLPKIVKGENGSSKGLLFDTLSIDDEDELSEQL